MALWSRLACRLFGHVVTAGYTIARGQMPTDDALAAWCARCGARLSG